MSKRTCPTCGAEIAPRGGPGRPRIYCSKMCSRRAPRTVSLGSGRTCDTSGCEDQHLAKGMCRRHYNLEYKRKPGWTRTQYEVTCVQCGTQHKASRRDAKYCSDECKGVHYAANGIGRQRTKCPLPDGHPVMVTIVKQRAAELLAAAQRKAEREATRFSWRTARECQACGAFFSPIHTPHMAHCSPSCSKAMHSRDRRALVRAVYIEPVNWRLVARRDGLACYLCGFDVDADDYEYRPGSDGRRAFIVGLEYPSVDHVTPLARGGEHSMANAKLAHAYCNSIKSDLPLEAIA